MKILIDALSMSHPQPGGYRTYTSNLVRHLQLVDQCNEYVVVVDRPIPWTAAPKWQLVIARRRSSLGVVWREQIAIPRIALEHKVTLVHSPAATGPLLGQIPLLVTLYDTIEFSEPLPPPWQTKRWSMRVYSRYVQRRVAQRAWHIITISQYSKRQIAEFFSIPEDRITAIYLAPSPIFSAFSKDEANQETTKRWGFSNPVLGIASAASRKNVGALLKAYALLPDHIQQKHPLVLVCTHSKVKPWIFSLANRIVPEERIHIIDKVVDADLVLLYNAASVFVFPSLEEGFGLPPLEAMACGTPVVASNTSAIPEVLGNAGVLISPTNSAEIAEAIHQVLSDPRLAQEMRAKGLARAAAFSWTNVAQQTVKVYEQLV